MAERTVTELYEARILDLQMLHKQMIEAHVLRFEDLRRRSIERESELKAQMDGVLGALGTVTAERDGAQKALAESEKCYQEVRADGIRALEGANRTIKNLEEKLSEAKRK